MRKILGRVALAIVVFLAFQRMAPRRSKCQWIVHSGAGNGCVARTCTTAPALSPRTRRSSGGHLPFTSRTTHGTPTGPAPSPRQIWPPDASLSSIGNPTRSTSHKIVDGSLDATIIARANGSKALGKKFFLDFAAEMNGDEAWDGNNAPLYIAAYRHIHDIFVAAGATNVIWAWCPNVTDIHGGNKNTMDYYPGDAYVDWTGVDGYNWGTKNGGWQTFQQVFEKIYPLLAARKKPIMIGEMSSAQVGGDKAKWIDEIIPTLRTSFPLIKCRHLVRHQQGSRLAHQLVSRIGSGIHSHGKKSLFQSVGFLDT